MRLPRWTSCALAGALALAGGISGGLSGGLAHGEPVTRIDVASEYPLDLPVLNIALRGLPARVRAVTDGELELVFNEPGALADGADPAAAIAAGSVAAAWTTSSRFAKHDSAFHLFTGVPFGPDINKQLSWLYSGGGLEISRELFQRYGVRNIPCGASPPQGAGWFRDEVHSLEELQHETVRFHGLGGQVLERLGVPVKRLAPTELADAMKSGAITAVEFHMPAVDEALRFHELAKFYYFPSWHQPASVYDLYLRIEVWEALPRRHQAAIELACGDVIREMIAAGDAAQTAAIERMKDSGVTLRRWPADMLVRFEKAWRDTVAEESRRNPNFAAAYYSMSQYSETSSLWRDLNAID